MAITAASLMVKVGADTTPAQRSLSSFSRSLGSTLNQGARQAENFTNQFNRAISGINTGVLQGLAGGLAGGLSFGAFNAGLNAVVGTVQGVVSEAANAYIETERLTMSLKAMSAQELVNAGSAKNFSEGLAMAGDRANELLGWIQDLAIESPFGTQDIAGVMRLGMVYGFNSEQAKRSTKAISDFGAAMGLTGPEMERVVRALGQMNQRGKVTSQELMQLSEVGVGGLQILADAAGVSAAEMQKMIENGVVPAGPAIEALIAKFEEYDGAAAANVGTLGGLLASMEDLKTIGLVDFFGPTFEAVQPKLDALVSAFKDEEFRAGLRETGEQFGAWVGYSFDALAGQVERMGTAIKEAPEGEPPLVSALKTIEPLQFESVAGDLQTISDVFTALSTGNTQLAFSIVYEQQDAEVQKMLDWVTWFGAESQREFTALVTFAQGTGEFWTEWGAWISGEANREVTLAANWADTTLATAWTVANEFFTSTPFGIASEWASSTLATAWVVASDFFASTPLGLMADWASTALTGLWSDVQSFFSGNPVTVSTQTSYTDTTRPLGVPPGQEFPIDITPPPPEYRIPGGASGFKNFRGGLALVGEKGPELVVLPAGADVIPNDKTMRMIPGFAEGTPGATSPFGGLSSSFGNMGDLAGLTAAKAIKDAAKDLSKSLKEVIGDLEDAIRSTPGVFGTSKVTADQMRMAELGVPQQFGDDYLRRLTDEVINGVDWAGVDIKEAAAAAGIDPNLPAQAILEMFRAAWADSSLFANPENLRFINQDAIKAQMERQQASEAGQSNIMALFGIGDEQLVNEIAGLGLEISTGLQTYLGEQGMGPVGAQAATGIGAGMAENGTPMGAGMVTGFMTWMTSPDGLTAIAGMGDGLVANLNQAFKKYAPGYDWTVPAGQGQPAPEGTTTPPGFASGTSWFRGGMALVGEQGPELVRLPTGSSVLNAGETAAAMGGVNVVVNAAVSQPHDIELLARRVARMIQQKRG